MEVLLLKLVKKCGIMDTEVNYDASCQNLTAKRHGKKRTKW